MHPVGLMTKKQQVCSGPLRETMMIQTDPKLLTTAVVVDTVMLSRMFSGAQHLSDLKKKNDFCQVVLGSMALK